MKRPEKLQDDVEELGSSTSNFKSIDQRIAELEAELDESSSYSESSGDDSGEESNDESHDPSIVRGQSSESIAAQDQSQVQDSSSSSTSPSSSSSSALILSNSCSRAEDRIRPLPKHLLPGFAVSSIAQKGKKRKRNSDHESKARNHAKRDKHFWQKARMEAMKAYEPHHNKSLYCRVCKQDFDNVELLFQHRTTPEHKEASRMERKLTYCNLCKKQFTSANQLSEHLKGKWHKQRASAMFNRSRGRGRGRGGGVRGRGRGQGRGGNIRGRGRGGGRGHRSW